MDSLQMAQLAALLANQGQQYTAQNPGQQAMLTGLHGSAQGAIQAEAQKKAEKEAEKKNKSKKFGSLGSALGTIAGVALAPVTGGASLAIPALTGAAGGAIGSAIGGGYDVGGSAMSGAVQGATGGLMGRLMGGGEKADPSITPTKGSNTMLDTPIAPPRTTGMQGALNSMDRGQMRKWYKNTPGAPLAVQSYLGQGGTLSEQQIRRMPRRMERDLEDAGYDVNRGRGLDSGSLAPLALWLLSQRGGF